MWVWGHHHSREQPRVGNTWHSYTFEQWHQTFMFLWTMTSNIHACLNNDIKHSCFFEQRHQTFMFLWTMTSNIHVFLTYLRTVSNVLYCFDDARVCVGRGSHFSCVQRDRQGRGVEEQVREGTGGAWSYGQGLGWWGYGKVSRVLARFVAKSVGLGKEFRGLGFRV